MHASGESYGVVGALRAFPLRLAARRVQALGGRLHRSVTRGTTARGVRAHAIVAL